MKFRFILFMSFFFALLFSATAQTKWQLEKKRKQLRKEIKEAQSLLFKSKQEEETLLSELNDINKVINVRSELRRSTCASVTNVRDGASRSLAPR